MQHQNLGRRPSIAKPGSLTGQADIAEAEAVQPRRSMKWSAMTPMPTVTKNTHMIQ